MQIRTFRLKSATQEVTVCPVGDLQWSGDEEDIAYDLLEEHLERCLNEPTPLFLGMGDYGDFASPSMRRALETHVTYDTAKKVIADASKALIEDLYKRLLKPTTGKWLGLTEGHHHHPVKIGQLKDGTAITQDSDVYLAKLLKTEWLEEMGIIKLIWPGGGVFRILAFHGSGSSVFPWGPLIKLYRLMPHFHVDLLLMGHQCLPTRARIMTARGFKQYNEVVIGEPVLAYDMATGTSRWTPLLDVTTYSSAPLLTARSKSFRLEMTPGHRMVLRNPNGSERLAAIEDAKAHESVVTCAIAEAGTAPISERDAAVLGWLVTDGSMAWSKKGIYGSYPNFQIGQKKPEYVAAIEDLLGDDATRHPRANGIVYFYLRAPLARRLHAVLPSKDALPALVTTLSRPARQAMLGVMIEAEGDGHRTFSQKAGPVWDAFLILTALEGLRCGVAKRQKSGFTGAVTLRNRLLDRSGPPQCGFLTVAPADPGAVWCPTTALDTWVAELDGQVFITGNTKKAVGEVDRLEFPVETDEVNHMTIKMVGTGGWMKGYINGRRTYVSQSGLGPVALGQPIIHLRPRIRKGRWDSRMTVES